MIRQIIYQATNRLTHLDKAALGAILALSVVLFMVRWLGNPAGLQATLIQADEGVGPTGPLVVAFDRPVNIRFLADKFSLEPQGVLSVALISPTQVSILPDGKFVPDEAAILRLAAGDYGANGESLAEERSWTIRLRSEQVVYLSTDSQPSELFRVGLDGAAAVQLTQTEGRVFDFAVAPNGEWIVYGVINQQNGVDLWQMNRTGQNSHILLDCGAQRCTTPNFDAEGKRLAYTRQSAGLTPGSPPGAPRPWLFEPATGQDTPLYADPQAIGYGPVWSPDGARIASWDGIRGGIGVLDLRTGEQVLLTTQSGDVGGWSPDGTQLLFTRYDVVEDTYVSAVYRANFTDRTEAHWITGGQRDAAYGTPVWSPDGRYIAIGMRLNDDSPARAVQIIRSDILDGPLVGGEREWSYAFYRWNTSGDALVLQRSRLGGQYVSEVVVYHLETGQVQRLAAAGGWPQWLP